MNLKKISRSDETANKNNVNNIFGEKTTRGRLIVMDVVSGLGDEQLLKNIGTAVFIFFIQYFQKRQFGDEFYHNKTIIIFFLQQFLYLEFGKFEKLLAQGKQSNIFHKMLFGSIDFSLNLLKEMIDFV